jgi:hypothetical protein
VYFGNHGVRVPLFDNDFVLQAVIIQPEGILLQRRWTVSTSPLSVKKGVTGCYYVILRAFGVRFQ